MSGSKHTKDVTGHGMSIRLGENRYGKSHVRVSKVRRPRTGPANRERHELVEASVDILLSGDFETAHTEADNTLVVATDTCKNTVYVLAKDHDLETPESFALALASHFLEHYEHVSKCEVTVRERVWTRLLDCDHAFTANGAMTPTAVATCERGAAPKIVAGLEGLTVAKTTESGFENFYSDEFRTLADTDDRIFATEVSASWPYASAEIDFAECRRHVVDALLARFVDHYSKSVQQTLYLMGQAALEACEPAESISLAMPNKHHLLVDLTPFDRNNANEVFVVTDEPYGYITATVTRA